MRRFAKIIKDAPKGSPPGLAHEAKKFFAEIYRIEGDIREADPDRRFEVRQLQTKPVMKDLHGWLAAHAPTVPPKSPLGEAFGYALSNWAALNTFVEHGILEADNISERAMKPVCVLARRAPAHPRPSAGPAGGTAADVLEACMTTRTPSMQDAAADRGAEPRHEHGAVPDGRAHRAARDGPAAQGRSCASTTPGATR
jgi:transposase